MPKVLVPLAQGCEELEAVTIIDLLRRAGITVITAGLDSEPVRASRGVVLVPDMKLEDALIDRFDMIVLPGGLPGADHLGSDPRIVSLIKEMARTEKFTAAICAAPVVLAKAGVLDGKRATSYPGMLEKLGMKSIQCSGEAVVRDGKTVTSRGPGTAMDFALELIEVLTDRPTRDKVEAALARS